MPRAIVDRVGIGYTLSGDGPETVALLNGIGMSMAHWKPVADRLTAAGFRVLAHDFRGQLLSDKPEGVYSFEGHARELAALLGELGLGAIHAVGTSYGAEVALTFARDFPDACASVVSIDGVSEYDGVLGAVIASWKAAAGDPRAFYRSLVPWNYSAEYIAANGAALAAREDLVASLPRDYFDAFTRLCDSFLALDLTKDLGRIRCPCLALVAAHDILKPGRYSRIIADGVPDALYQEIPGAGHAVVVERPDAVADSILSFLEVSHER